jgi:outer membrane lipopolysaccharide assembly protein LptE/RlpB
MRAFSVLLLLMPLAGCGYHTVGSATHVPANVRTLAVPIFGTKVLAYHTEVAFTGAVVRELNTRTRWKILNDDTKDADAVLHGTILTQTPTPLTYDATSGQTSSYRITFTAQVILTARDGRELWRNDAFSFYEQYQSTQDLNGFIQEDTAAVNRTARDFAQAVVSDMLESF